MAVRFSGGFKGGLYHAHLGAIAVDHYNFVARLNKVHDSLGRHLGGGHLFLQGIPEGVTPQGDNDSLPHEKHRGIFREIRFDRVSWGHLILERKIIAAMT
jgi:hypothetical protein